MFKHFLLTVGLLVGAFTAVGQTTTVEQVLEGQIITSEPGLIVNSLGTSNTLIRISGNAHFLLLPIQESIDEAAVKVLVDGRQDDYLNIKLAKTKVDYYVPFDLTPYSGHTVALSVQTQQGRANVREAKDDVCWKNLRLADSFDTSNREKYRPAYHHTPLYGWMNDPNGMFYKDGVWHLYYQHNPYGSKWQNLSWGHSTSTDLVHWNAQKEALTPDGLGMIFSGSSVVDSLNTAGFGAGAIVSIYTSADESQKQSLAYSTDGGQTFTTYSGNPILTLPTEARDPNMFWDNASRRWVLVLAHALDHEMLFFTSPDLKNWILRSAFGKGLAAQGGVWECPDLFELQVEGETTRKWVLLCNLNPGGPFGGSATQYFIGDFDGETFTPDTNASGIVPTKWMDFGKDHYATVSWSNCPDGRRTVLGWMSNWQYAAEVPTRQFRSANTLPREVKLFRAADKQVYLVGVPSPELLSLRGKANVQRFALSPRPHTFTLPSDGLCEITAEIDAARSGIVTMDLANAEGEKVSLTYDVAAQTLTFDRRQGGLSDFSQDFAATCVAPTFGEGKMLKLRIFIDRSSIEIFGERFSMTNLVFPTKPYTALSIKGEGPKSAAVTIYPLNIK